MLFSTVSESTMHLLSAFSQSSIAFSVLPSDNTSKANLLTVPSLEYQKNEYKSLFSDRSIFFIDSSIHSTVLSQAGKHGNSTLTFGVLPILQYIFRSFPCFAIALSVALTGNPRILKGLLKITSIDRFVIFKGRVEKLQKRFFS